MKEKTLIDVKQQMYRIDMMMLNKNFTHKSPKRWDKWCQTVDSIDRKLLGYFGVNHLWEDAAYLRSNEPLPYEVRITH